MSNKYSFYKKEPNNKIWWVDNEDVIGEYIFTFDRKRLFNLFRDYPHGLNVREWILFNKENPYWEKFFSERNEDYKEKHEEEIFKIKQRGTQGQ